MLKRGSYSGLVIIGNAEHEAELKQLKVNIYALLGKMSLEVGVQLELEKEWSESAVLEAVARGVKAGDIVYGALCIPAHDGDRLVDSDILTLDENQLVEPWNFSAGFLHSTAKSLLPKIRSNPQLQRGTAGYFLVTGPKETNPISKLYGAACDSIIGSLAKTHASSGVTIAYAENVLVPEPEPVKINGKLHLSAHTGPIESDIDDLPPAESPTRLWNMWALQDELGVAD